MNSNRKKIYYFAYGSNMCNKQMKSRCPSSHFVKPAYLENVKFVYDGKSVKWDNKAVANTVAHERSVVWGALFEINRDNLAALDCYEGYPNSYGKQRVRVKDEEGNVYRAWVYFRIGKKLGKPSKEYRDTVLEGAKECGLPKHYVKLL